MKKETVIENLTLYESVLKYSGFLPKSRIDGGNEKEHVAWMCGQAKTYVNDGKLEKAMRWLGFVQGCLFTWKVYSIDEMKEHNAE